MIIIISLTGAFNQLFKRKATFITGGEMDSVGVGVAVAEERRIVFRDVQEAEEGEVEDSWEALLARTDRCVLTFTVNVLSYELLSAWRDALDLPTEVGRFPKLFKPGSEPRAMIRCPDSTTTNRLEIIVAGRTEEEAHEAKAEVLRRIARTHRCWLKRSRSRK